MVVAHAFQPEPCNRLPQSAYFAGPSRAAGAGAEEEAVVCLLRPSAHEPNALYLEGTVLTALYAAGRRNRGSDADDDARSNLVVPRLALRIPQRPKVVEDQGDSTPRHRPEGGDEVRTR